MSAVLRRWNLLDDVAAARAILPCCGSSAWAARLAAGRPFAEEGALLAASDAVWWGLPEEAWQEAFESHPRIGEQHAVKVATVESLRWSAEEQRAAASPDAVAAAALEAGNRAYEKRFGRTFIVCAAGRSRAGILTILEARMDNDAATELREAAEQQRMITQLRLRRWLEEH